MPRPVGDGLSGVAGEKQTLVWNWLIQESARQIFALCSSTQSIAQFGSDARTTRDWWDSIIFRGEGETARHKAIATAETARALSMARNKDGSRQSSSASRTAWRAHPRRRQKRLGRNL